MRTWWFVILAICLMTGCSAQETFETVNDEVLLPVVSQQRQICMTLPADAALGAISEEDGGKLYLCDDYILTVQVLTGGNLDDTAKTVCGFSGKQLTMIPTTAASWERYDWTWSSAGEGGDHVGRAAVLDDGQYHYCVSAMAPAASATQLETKWSEVFASLRLD